MSAFTVWELPNGIRAVHRAAEGTQLVHCGVVFDVGSRDERPHEQGMAHFIEHMVFKGTRRRRAFHILNRIDAVGGELNAYTTKEKTVYHATVTHEYAPRALDLLADIAFDSTLPAHEVEKEKTVIADEIDLYRDDPEEAIFEDFDRHVFGRHPLAHPIAGSKAVIAGFDRGQLHEFMARHYAPERAVVSVLGRCSLGQAQRWVERAFGGWAARGAAGRRRAPRPVGARSRQLRRAGQQAHVLLGGPAYALGHPHHAALQLLNHHLGGPAMNSRLNLRIRERYGLGYNIQSFYTPFVDAGIWGVYASVEPEAVERLLALVRRELEALRRAPLSTAALARLQRQYIGSLIIAHESHFQTMIAQAKDLLDFGQVLTLEAAVAQVQALTPRQVHAVAEALFAPDRLDLLVAQP